MLGSDSAFPVGEPHPVTFVKNALPTELTKLVLEMNFERLIGG